MSISRRLNPRAGYWRTLKIAKAKKVVSARALESDLRAVPAVQSRNCMRRVAARNFWQRPHPWVLREI